MPLQATEISRVLAETLAEAMPLRLSSVSHTTSPGCIDSFCKLLPLRREDRPLPNFGSEPKNTLTDSEQVTRSVTDTETGPVLAGAAFGSGAAGGGASLPFGVLVLGGGALCHCMLEHAATIHPSKTD